jgi:hypothetical protein
MTRNEDKEEEEEETNQWPSFAVVEGDEEREKREREKKERKKKEKISKREQLFVFFRPL